MKISRRQLRKLIQETLNRVPVFDPVTKSELDSIRNQSRIRAGIGDDYPNIEKLRALEQSSDPSVVSQARSIYSAFGSETGEISGHQEQDFFEAQRRHMSIARLSSYFGNAVYNMDIYFLESFLEFIDSLMGKTIDIWIFDGQNYDGSDIDSETVQTVENKFKNQIYALHSYGDANITFEEAMSSGLEWYENEDLQNDFANELYKNGISNPDYAIFKVLKDAGSKIIIKNAT